MPKRLEDDRRRCLGEESGCHVQSASPRTGLQPTAVIIIRRRKRVSAAPAVDARRLLLVRPSGHVQVSPWQPLPCCAAPRRQSGRQRCPLLHTLPILQELHLLELRARRYRYSAHLLQPGRRLLLFETMSTQAHIKNSIFGRWKSSNGVLESNTFRGKSCNARVGNALPPNVQ